jgi:hypothetical protein
LVEVLRVVAVEFTHLCVSPRKELLSALRALLDRTEHAESMFLEEPELLDAVNSEAPRWPESDPPLARAFSHIINQSLYMQTLSLMVDEGDASQVASATTRGDVNLPIEVHIAQLLDSCLWRKSTGGQRAKG